MNFLMPSAGRVSRVSFLAGAALAALFAVSFAACDDEGGCCAALAVCSEGSVEVDACATDDCFTVEKCCDEALCEPVETCQGVPTCPFEQNEVPSCDETTFGCKPVSLCGSTIYCDTPPPCEAVPSCDEGDEEQPSGVCPEDASCYTAELCGMAILCLDNGLAHGCPPEPPLEGEPCPFEVVCEYPVEVDCVEIWECDSMGGQAAPIVTFAWHSGGTVCADPAN